MKDVLIRPEAYADHLPRARAAVEAEFDNRCCVMRLHALFRDALARSHRT